MLSVGAFKTWFSLDRLRNMGSVYRVGVLTIIRPQPHEKFMTCRPFNVPMLAVMFFLLSGSYLVQEHHKLPEYSTYL